jgi:glycolate oxidase FAD binding subunit
VKTPEVTLRTAALASADALLDAAGLRGRAVARLPGASDSVDGIAPAMVLEPESAEATAAALAWASSERLSVVLRGGGTKLGWGRPPTAVDLIVSMRRVARLLAHRHGDLTATVEAGATLDELNRELANHEQRLPVESAFPEATIGGIIATNDSGPLRHRHGTARDLLIGISLATTDGRLVKAGGSVVKNVAGYDLGKLMSGSFGGLAAIVSATFKLAPLPASSTTLVADFGGATELARAVSVVGASQLEPTMCDVVVSVPVGGRPTYRLLIQFASVPSAVAAQTEAARGVLAADKTQAVSGAEEAEVWQRQSRAIWTAPGAIVRTSWLPANLAELLAHLGRIGLGASVDFVGRGGVGAGLIRIAAAGDVQASAIAGLRAAVDVFAHVVVLRAEAHVKKSIDVWNMPGDSAALLVAVKRAFDPHGILNAGRGPV